MMWLFDGGKSLTICLAVSTQYRRVTNGTDKQTSCDSIVRAMHTHRAAKVHLFSIDEQILLICCKPDFATLET